MTLTVDNPILNLRLPRAGALLALRRGGRLLLGFVIPYTVAGASHNFFPDFLVRLANGATLVLEVKGHEDEQDRAKYAAATRWCEAVSNWGQMGRWVFDHCAGPGSVRTVLARHAS